MKIIRGTLFIVHLFVGFGALAGGFAAITDPWKPLGITVDALKYSPFHNFFIPGLILFLVMGLGNIFCAFLFHFKTRYQGYVSGVFSGALVIWIIVQCIMLRAVASLHVIFFLIGFVQGILALSLLFEQRLFPANIILAILKKVKLVK